MSACCACSESAPSAPSGAGQWFRLAVAGLIAGQSMIFSLAVNLSPPPAGARTAIHGVLAAAAVAVFLLAGLPILREAWAGLRARRVVMEQLFLCGIAGAFGASIHSTITGYGHVYYEVVAILIAIYTFGKLIGETRRRAALEAARALGGEFDECERLGRNGLTSRVRVADVVEGDLLLVRAGGGIPVDGVVVEGVGFVQETSLTGEPFPVVKRAGDAVLAGCSSVDGLFTIRSGVTGNARRLDALLEAVRTAQDRGSELQREADRLVAWFLPSVLVVSALTFAFWTWRENWVAGVFNALAVVLVACPCSMGLATPVGIWSALAALGGRGVIPRGENLVERLARVDCVVFDKTGTLGEPELERVDFVEAEGEDRQGLLRAVAALEASSNHPVARGFRISEVQAVPTTLLAGAGLEGEVGGASIRVGNSGVLPAGQIEAAERLAAQLRVRGSHLVYVVRNGIVAGVAALSERLRDGAMTAIRELQSMGLHCEVMTGDRAEAAAVHGLPNVHAGLTPAQKSELVAGLRASGRRVLFVGDGVNDTPAMSGADVAFSIGSGSALARETADAEIRDLGSIPFAIQRSRQAVGAIRGNLLFAAAYNVVGILLAAAGVLNPVVAALLMLASSFTVTWRALRDVAPPRRTVPWNPRNLLACAALALQGPVIVYLAAFQGAAALSFLALFLGGGLVAALVTLRRPMSAYAGMAFSMFSFGGLAMLAGWWADAGFAAIVRDGACLCGCAKSNFGLGLFAKATWMDLSMVAASMPGLFFERAPRGRIWCWLAGLVGMLIGMEAAAGVMAFIPVNNPQAIFFATYGAMMFGMCIGMLAACGGWSRWRGN